MVIMDKADRPKRIFQTIEIEPDVAAAFKRISAEMMLKKKDSIAAILRWYVVLPPAIRRAIVNTPHTIQIKTIGEQASNTLEN